MSNKSLTALIVGVVLAIVAWNSFYIVPDRASGIAAIRSYR
jgi:hypothetical protein